MLTLKIIWCKIGELFGGSFQMYLGNLQNYLNQIMND